MDTDNRYSQLLQKYPQYMSKEQLHKECRISKKTCLFLLESGLVPCIDSGKQTHRFLIETTEVIHYLRNRDLQPELYKAPDGFYKMKTKPRKMQRPLTEVDLPFMRQYYEETLEHYPDVLSITQISEFTGYGQTSVVDWCSKRQLKSFLIKGRYRVPKEYLMEFLLSRHFIGISVKSQTHKTMNAQIRAYIREQQKAL